MVKKTILYDQHVAFGAKMAPFGGYSMPIQYSGIIKEHKAAREHLAIFDTCHMGEFIIKGKNVVADLERLLSCSVDSIAIGQCRYGFLCNEKGGVIDDQILYRIGVNEFFMVVNAATEPSDFTWIQQHLSPDTTIENRSEETAKLDIQGPKSPEVMAALMDEPIDSLRFYRFMENYYNGAEVLVSRTGYTGEIGFEIYCDPSTAKELWRQFLDSSAVPTGLGARDTLRLEMGFPLYGHELDSERNAAESGFTRAIAKDKSFIGSSVVLDPSQKRQQLVGVSLESRKSARHGDTIIDSHKNPIGIVTSGSFSPSLHRAIAMAYVDNDFSAPGTGVVVGSGRHELKGTVTELPFYRNATGRKSMKEFI